MLTSPPQRFLHFFTLRTGILLIVLTQLINKVTAFYGILALATSYPLSPLQLSMYIYSLIALVLTLYLLPGVRKQDPWSCLAFAQTYVVDTLVNGVYTLLFALAWFVVVADHDAQRLNPVVGGIATEMIDKTSGFTSPQYNVSHVEVIAAPAAGLKPGQEAVAMARPGFASAVLSSGSLMSLFIVCSFEALRMYALFVCMSYARQVLRQHIAVTSSHSYIPYSAGTADMAEDPFGVGREEGKGWRGTIGRAMVAVGREYWLGREERDDEIWMTSVGRKFRKSGEQRNGTTEREKRRRSGTDPPKPAPGIAQGL